MVVVDVPVQTCQNLGIGLVTVGEVISACIITVSLEGSGKLIHIGSGNAAYLSGIITNPVL